MNLGSQGSASIKTANPRHFLQKNSIGDFTYAQKFSPSSMPLDVALFLKLINIAICKSLISLDIFSCTSNKQYDETLDFQGFAGIPTGFSTKLSTDFLDTPQNAEKSTTYNLFQDFS